MAIEQALDVRKEAACVVDTIAGTAVIPAFTGLPERFAAAIVKTLQAPATLLLGTLAAEWHAADVVVDALLVAFARLARNAPETTGVFGRSGVAIVGGIATPMTLAEVAWLELRLNLLVPLVLLPLLLVFSPLPGKNIVIRREPRQETGCGPGDHRARHRAS